MLLRLRQGVGLLLLVVGLGALSFSLFQPWAVVAPFGLRWTGIPVRGVPMIVPMTLLLMAGGSTWFWLHGLRQRTARVGILVAGVGAVTFGAVVLFRVGSEDLRLLGIPALTLAEARPEIGIAFCLGGGALLVLAGMILGPRAATFGGDSGTLAIEGASSYDSAMGWAPPRDGQGERRLIRPWAGVLWVGAVFLISTVVTRGDEPADQFAARQDAERLRKEIAALAQRAEMPPGLEGQTWFASTLTPLGPGYGDVPRVAAVIAKYKQGPRVHLPPAPYGGEVAGIRLGTGSAAHHDPERRPVIPSPGQCP